MQRSSSSVYVSMQDSTHDRNLINIKNTIETSYWANDKEGVFEFQMLVEDSPVTNTSFPLYFQLVRYTPTDQYYAFQLNMSGRIDNMGYIEYAGRIGKLINNNQISWNDGVSWYKVNKVQQPQLDILNLNKIETQAAIDSNIIGTILEKIYMY